MRKLTIEQMQSIAESRGGRCLTTEYVNCKTKLDWVCAHGHPWSATPSDIKSGRWCPTCAGHEKLTIEQMQALAEERGGKCLSTEYVNARTNLDWVCAHGHRFSSAPDSVKNGGGWCSNCSYLSRRLTIDDMHSLAESKGGKCESAEYVNAKTKLDWVCAHGHPWSATPNRVQQSTWCPTCARLSQCLTIEEMHSLAESKGGKCESTEYVNNYTKLKWVCANGHRWSAKPTDIKSGHWCGICSRGIGERICRAYFRQIFGIPFPKARPRWLKNSRGNQMELDGYCKELRIAFEHQGLQHYKQIPHFELSEYGLSHRQADDRAKVQLCKERGIRLVCIPSLFEMTKLDDFQQWLYTECQKLGIETPDGMLMKQINLKSAWKNTRTVKFTSDMHSLAEEHGGKCLSTEYVHSHHRLEWECAHGHRWWDTFGHVKMGRWCSICSGQPMWRDSLLNRRSV